jgi:hypothetical protein
MANRSEAGTTDRSEASCTPLSMRKVADAVHFDLFTIQQWRECYTLQVQIERPRNAPRGKFTKADKQRALAANRKNRELLEREFTTLEEVIEEIQRLQFPASSG